MRQHLLIIVCALLLLSAAVITTAAQDAEPTALPIYDPTCPINLMKAYISGWEYNHRSPEGDIDVVVAAQVAREVHKAFSNAKVTCQDTMGNLKQSLLRSLHGDYLPEDLARMLGFVDEAVGSFQYDDCSYNTANQFVQRVEWGDTSPIQAGRTVSEIFRTVREAVPDETCDGTFQIIQEIMSHMDDVPPDSTLIGTLYKVVGEATEGHYVSEYSCAYTLAKTFLQKVDWDDLTSADIVQLVGDTFKITYKIGGDGDCDQDASLAITAMLLNDMYRIPPDASLLQRAYDAATGELVVTPEATAPPIVN